MFPHQKLDWTLSRLERHLDQHTDDVASRVQYAEAALSRAWFHDGGEMWFNKALTQARRVLQHDPSNPRATVVAGASLTGLDRLEPAGRYLDQAMRLDPERADVHLAMGELHLRRGEKHQAVRELEFACREAADSWEPHAQLGLLLRQRAAELGHPPRVLERSQFHIVRALQLTPSPAWTSRLEFELALSCLQTGRLADAHKLLSRLVEQQAWRARARYHLGLVSMHMGKYKNAVLQLRQHLEEHGDHPHVHAKIAVCYLHLGEIAKAREACHRALALEPDHLEARWTLGSAFLEEDRVDDGVRLFKEILHDAPWHTPAFAELVRLRKQDRDVDWLAGALRSEVSLFDRLPLQTDAPDGRPVRPRETTRERVLLIIKALGETAEDAASALLESLALTTDEGLRAELWEHALTAMAQARARDAVRWLQEPGRYYGAARGQEILSLASLLPEPALTRGLQLSEEDLQRAAVDRHGPATDVQAHRRKVEGERQQARAWQSLLLLALAERGSDTARNLLVRWATEADPELATVARAGLAMLGDGHAVSALREHARGLGATGALDNLLRAASPAEDRSLYRPISDDEQRTCATCGRRTGEVDHMMVRNDVAMCDRCLTAVARKRSELATDDPRVRCVFTGKSLVESREIYVYQGIAVAAEVVDRSLGLLEREEVDRFLAAW